MIDKFRLDDLRLESGEKGELARWVIQLQTDLDRERRKDGNSPVIPEEKGSSLQLRNLIRKRHAEWSETTFGNVGPIGPLKHVSKEALEAADDIGDFSEWADMQFLLWDAQRRAGISDGEITAAMEVKLKVNMARQWPEPKDGEPRLHIKAVSQPAPENNDRQTLRRLAVILAGNDAPGEIMALTVTAQSFVDRCKALVAERDELRKIVSAVKGDECTS